MAKTKKKKVKAIADGMSRIKATAGFSTRLTTTVISEVNGLRNTETKTVGRICIPVLINQPAFITDQLQTTAATTQAIRMIHDRGHRKQTRARITSIPNSTAISASIQPKYSLIILVRYE